MRTLKNFTFLLVYSLIFIVINIACEKELEIVEPEKESDTTVVKKSDTTVVAVKPPSEPEVIKNGNYYVSVTGKDENPGTIDSPFKTIEKALSVAGNTDLIYVRGGTYPLKDPTKAYGLKLANKHGKDSVNKLKIWAYPGERVVIDCKSMTMNTDGIYGLWITSNNLHIKGFDVMNVPQHKNPKNGRGNYSVGILVAGTCILLEDCSAHDCQGTGINLGGNSCGSVILNCDAYNNYDPYTYTSSGDPYDGGNADGFHITVEGAGSTQVFKGCRAWNNSDDGYDCFNTDGYVDFDGCWAFKNGYLPSSNNPSKGDGSGFKLGATIGQYSVLKKNIRNCVSAFNRMEGFTQNNGRVIMHVYNNTAYKNGGMPFDFANQFSGQNSVELKNNIAIGTKNYIPYAAHDHNSWDSPVTADDSDFQSVDPAMLSEKRQSNGNIPNNQLFRLAASSDLKNAGVDLGYGKNIGAY